MRIMIYADVYVFHFVITLIALTSRVINRLLSGVVTRYVNHCENNSYLVHMELMINDVANVYHASR